ncbi:MAG: hypothetical protein M4579_007231 [Chaenotheca gracillima]|nr:MAG: hypothetical protein M4579_007231 [Chaenotheca gracillima]
MSVPSVLPVSPTHPGMLPNGWGTDLQHLHAVEALNDAEYKALAPIEERKDSADDHETLLISSPYRTKSHLLDLSTISKRDSLLARAFTSMKATRPDYATASYVDSFNWTSVVEKLRTLAVAENYPWTTSSFYLIAFRSQSLSGANRIRLSLLDEKSHEEANESGGLLKYWFGQPDADFRNLATCVWSGRSDAMRANTKEHHRQAMVVLREMYCTCQLERYELTITDNVESWTLEPYVS